MPCTACRSDSLVRDDITGDLVCSHCGFLQVFDNFQAQLYGLDGPQGTYIRHGSVESSCCRYFSQALLQPHQQEGEVPEGDQTLHEGRCHFDSLLVLDEADRLLNEEFEKSLDEILKVIPRERRTFLFSATMTKKVRKLQRACLRNPVKIEAASKYSTVDTLKQQFHFIPAKHKDCYLVYILTEMSSSTTMVFTRTCDATSFLALVLRNLGFRAIPISGHMSQSKRLGALNKFKAGECNILVCTDVASRGLDIPSVDMVINYDIPSNSKDYIHRVGRTARAGRSGVAISLVNQYELEWYLQIEKLIGKKLPEFPSQEEEVLLLLERVTEAKRLSQMKMKEMGHNRKRRGGDDEEGIDRYLGIKDKKSSKKFRRK